MFPAKFPVETDLIFPREKIEKTANFFPQIIRGKKTRVSKGFTGHIIGSWVRTCPEPQTKPDLRSGSGFAFFDKKPDLTGPRQHYCVWILSHRITGSKVNVIECSSYYPFNTVIKFHSTPVFVRWTDKVIWFGYADLGHFQQICSTQLLNLPPKWMIEHRNSASVNDIRVSIYTEEANQRAQQSFNQH
ncbi:hypothetical protein C8R43DRAFT_1199130 [Mycena crocata]|nr:hypothetical protein C8R43DRAFT_1199130 [Mycena crocata]